MCILYLVERMLQPGLTGLSPLQRHHFAQNLRDLIPLRLLTPLPNLGEAGQQVQTNMQALGSGVTLPPLGSHGKMPSLQAARCFHKDLESQRANKCEDLTVSPACLFQESLCGLQPADKVFFAQQ